ncbi:type I methionyl aminopeptidase [Candidatus Gottesmanbacteria bacterium RIFCSPLOWO2_01_FULL_48_11]|uniref:Methionine aminopeptidase n=3 Tax=Candidatus Gottesmaniibacteriota TaxID=1752720 RepID=A0A0G1U2H9_9BACT|nr:MAG: Methionine aminopeptidase [Candidatus Gottesmanbacteria bacterium GW2011_GWA2_47_9]OGG26612.1 MAG: type I methionyl aminopeptidase [Candidatus Gottesmanbacteria bacterium RIFCSPLOWO2_01_FULL_48_11]
MNIKTKEEIAIMKEGGSRLASILQELLDLSQPGVTLLSIDTRADELIAAAGGFPSFKTVKGYSHATCLCLNDEVVHGVPNERVLKEGDLLTIDIGLVYQGLHTDTAWTKIMQSAENKEQSEVQKDKEQFLKIGEEALWKGIREARVGNRIGNISKVIQETIEGAGYSIVKTLVGHGVGRELHEAPQVPNFLKGDIGSTSELEEGMTIAIEPIYAVGGGDIVYSNTDGWTLATKDRSLSAECEHTIAITAGEPLVLTGGAT